MTLRLSLAAALVTMAAPAYACSVEPGYRVPTTLELAVSADAIVLAKIGSVSRVTPAELGDRLTLTPLRLLKGRALPNALEIRGYLESDGRRATRSSVTELARANPDAFSGGCNRYVFAKGMTLLLFLKRDGDGWRVIDEPFARTAEDVRSSRARWVKAVREYVAIAAIPQSARQAGLTARRNLLARQPGADSRAIAADMARELAGPRKPLREPLPTVPD